MARFPHLNDTAFPGTANIDVYRYRNTFDYKRWGVDVKIKLMQVPWDGINDVPYFESDDARDAWMDSRKGESQVLTSAINVLPDNTVPLPFPFDVMSRYNYIMVEFPIMPNAGDPLAYENGQGVNRFFFFVYAIEQKAANCTQCMLERDDWVTFINSCDASYLMLERGHAPMAAIDVDTYLSNPIDNNALLLAPDVNYGGATNVSAINDIVLNDGEIYACIATTADPQGSWGSKQANDWKVPAASSYNVQGAPACYTFAVPASSLVAFMSGIDEIAPQFKRTVQAVFFVSEKLISLGASFTFANVECRAVGAQPINLELLAIDKSSFDYPDRYAGIAKLYTYPYAQIEVTDESGNVTLVMIEDTTGSLQLACAVSLAYPMIGIDAHLLGYGSSQRRTLSFKNIDARTATVQGTWYKTLMHWDVPTFAVVQRASIENDYATHYDREQKRTAYDNAYAASVASANTGKANADASANTGVTNTANAGIAQTQNTALAIAASTATVARSNEASTAITSIGNATSQAAQAYDAGLQRGVQEADAQAVAATTLTNAIGNLAGSIASGAMSGGIAGAGAAAVGGVISGVTSGVNAAVMLNAASTKVELSISNSQSKVTSQNNSNTSTVNESTDAQTDNNDTASQAATQQTANSVETANTNAENSANTAKANAARTQGTSINNAGISRDTSISAVANQIAQAGLSAPGTFGSFSGGSDAITRPMIASANVLTQSKAAISQAGDQMLRYGYALNQQWKVTTFSLMPKFTYWKASEAWIVPGKGVIEGAREKIKNILENGVTVWNDPDEIGKVSIYDNV